MTSVGSLAAVVTTGEAPRAQSRFAADALESQRRRLLALFGEFDAAAWDAVTRCDEWSAHEVVRHLRDVTVRWTALLQGVSPADAGMAGMDPRTTPQSWLRESADETPARTVAGFAAATDVLLAEVRRRLDDEATDSVVLPFGEVPWSVAVLHAFWDAWLHERDILLPRGEAHTSPPVESRAAAMFGLVMSAVPSTLSGGSFDEVLALDGDGGGLFRVTAADGVVTVSTCAHPEVEPLRGSLPEVVDSLMGRAPALSDAVHGPADRVERIGTLRRFMLSQAR